MQDKPEKTQPDYPIRPSWRPASQPGVRLPAPTLEPIPEGDPQTAPVGAHDVAEVKARLAAVPPVPPVLPPAPAADATPAEFAPRPAPSPRALVQSGYSLAPASQENLRPYAVERPGADRPAAERPISGGAVLVPASAPAIDPPAAHVPASQPHFRPASNGFVHPGSPAAVPVSPVHGYRPGSGGFNLGLDPAAGAAQSRRAADPTRLLPWLRDKNKRVRDIDPTLLQAMFFFASLQRVPANTIVQPLDAPPTACFAVVEGALVSRGLRANGALREVDRTGPGELVGLLALVDPRPSPYEIVAATACELITFEADKLGQYLAALHPTAMLALQGWTPILVDHLRTVQHRLSRLSAARRNKVEARDDDAWRGGR